MDFTNYLLQHVTHKHIGSQIYNKKSMQSWKRYRVFIIMRLFQVNISIRTVIRNANFGRSPRFYRAIRARTRIFFPHFCRSRKLEAPHTLAILHIQWFPLFYW